MKIKIDKNTLREKINDCYLALTELKFLIVYTGEHFIIYSPNSEIVAILNTIQELDYFVFGFVKGLNENVEELIKEDKS